MKLKKIDLLHNNNKTKIKKVTLSELCALSAFAVRSLPLFL